MMQAPVVVMNTTHGRETGRKAQLSNVRAAKTVADVIRTCLGPQAMLKMILDPMGGIVLTNDGNAILRECEVSHPAAKSMIELARTQDEEVGDGTTSVIILAGEILACAAPFFDRQIHPIIIISAFKRALDDLLSIVDGLAKPVNLKNRDEMLNIVKTSIGTKYTSRWGQMMCQLAIRAVETVSIGIDHCKAESDKKYDYGGRPDIDIKRYVRIEKIPGGEIEDSQVLDGVMLNKDVVHPKMKRHIKNPRIILLDCPLEYKKGESQTNIEIQNEADWNRILEIEEEQIRNICEKIIELKPDLVFTEKGVSDLASHFLLKAGISAIRRLRKTDNNRIARATGATIVHRVDDLQDHDVGTGCGTFKIEKIGDEYFTFLVDCKSPKACTVMLRGPSKDILQEMDRNLQDAMSVTRNVFLYPALCPGGGATEMAVSVGLKNKAKSIEGTQKWPYLALAEALEVIPRTLIQNCGGNAIKVLTELRAVHAQGKTSYGVDGEQGMVVDMNVHGVWEPHAVKVQTFKTAIESACLLLRVDDILSGVAKKKDQQSSGPVQEGPGAGGPHME